MSKTIIGAVVVIIIVGGGAFYAGMAYSKGQAPAATARGQFGGAGFAGRTGGRGAAAGAGFTTGSIVSTGNGSITIQSAMSSSTEIVLLGNSTQILKSVSGSPSDLLQGVNVVVTGSTNSDGSLTAQSIQIRPAGMTGGFGGPRGTGASAASGQ